jgi:dihydropyrimidinase
MADLLARRPARAFGLYSKGVIEPGADADLAIWDPEGSWTIGDDYPTWKGIKVRGAVRTVLRRGEVMVENGELLADRSAGEHLRREGSGL